VSDEEEELRELAERLAAARDAAAAAAGGRPPLGVRAVEPAPGRRGYLVAFEGPGFLCLAGDLTPERGLARARRTASAGLLWEHAEELVDADALRELARAVGSFLARGARGPGVAESSEALERVAARAIELAAWRERPIRALARVEDLDEAARLQERLAGAYARFMRASDPLVAVQETLDAELVQRLRAVEEAAGRAGAGERLADRLARALPDSDEGADQILAAHITRLRDEP
jgi:voltage-gated potassium channel Kch